MGSDLTPPHPLAPEHLLGSLSCGVEALDTWLTKRARANHDSGASRVYVACQERTVLAYYALASGSVIAAAATGRFRRNMPDPAPVVILGRLAIDVSMQGRGIGRALFRDAALRVLNAAETIGIRGLVVHAISEEAREFYLRLGLSPSPVDPFTLMTTLADLSTAVGER